MIDFEAGYQEWNVTLDGEIVYTFDDLVDQIPYPLTDSSDLEDAVDDLIDEMRYQIDTEEVDMDTYTKNELYENLDELKKAMIKRIFYEYGEAA